MIVRYAIQPAQPGAHLFQVTVRIESSDPQGQRFRLPAWIPGSYMVRDFARHVGRVRALDDRNRRLSLGKTDKQTWQCEALSDGRGLTLAYEVYAFDLSVRAAHLDTTHAFFNASSVFLLPDGFENSPCEVSLIPPPAQAGCDDWRIATSLTACRGTRQGSFGQYRAADHRELIDSPVEMGRFRLSRFEAGGVPHEFVLTGNAVQVDFERLREDLALVCHEHVRLFEPRRKAPPFERYTFLTFSVDEGYGGLEHRQCTALICQHSDLPHLGADSRSSAYRKFLGLASHEYFHAWNVTRIKPSALVNPDLSGENYTRLLWVFEGFTSYYDDLALRRAGLLTRDQYLAALAETLSDVLRRPGRLRQSLEESSFDAWIKYYKQDENAPNSIVSYYQKGALVALALDLHIRIQSGNRRSLDDVMRRLWRDFQRAGANYAGVGEDDVPRLIVEATGVDAGKLLTRWVGGTDDPDFESLFKPFGVAATREPDRSALGFSLLGCRFAAGNEGRIAQVYEGTAAMAAGLSAGDTVIALDSMRTSGHRLETLLARYQPGDEVVVHAFRRDQLMQFRVRLARQLPVRWILNAAPAAGRTQLSWQRRWLGMPSDASLKPVTPAARRPRRPTTG